jgi:simple sugar transport system ATP-binding protein
MTGIAKRFGETVALARVDFAAARGEIHGLLGENGAGKTTLMNVLSGLYRADQGAIAIDGAPTAIASPSDALGHGIGMVHQHVELVANFTVLENVLLGREGGDFWLRPERQRRGVEAIAERFGLTLDLDAEVRQLAVGVQQKVEILKALYRGVDVLILDEPTTMLTPQEVDTLFATLRAMAEQGLTVIFITHKIREIRVNCDRVTVMRGGRRVATLARADMDEGKLVELMIGERLQAASVVGHAAGGGRVLEVEVLSVPGGRGRPDLTGCSLRVDAAEVVGVAGVAGNGQRELADALAGVLRPTGGRIRLGGRDVTAASVRARIATGLVLIPEDRIQDGLLPGLSVAENLVLGLHPFVSGRTAFDRGRARALTREAIDEYAIRARGADAPAVELSGGNIQKVLVARAMAQARATGGRLLVATNPTRGLDVRATDFVRRRCLAFAADGGGVLLISEDLDELRQLCHRIVVMFRGRIVADLPRERFDPYVIGRLMAGVESPEALR